jgi:hypothetical protein
MGALQREAKLSDDLKRMLDDAMQQASDRDKAKKNAKQKSEDAARTSGQQLRERVLPRLQAAKEAWKGKLELDIQDQSDRFQVDPEGHTRSYPTITASATVKEHAAYAFVAHYPGHVSVQDAAGRNRGNQAYEFKVQNFEDLTDAKISEILQSLLEIALGLKPGR